MKTIDTVIKFRCSPSKKVAYDAWAKSKGLTVSSWLQSLADTDMGGTPPKPIATAITTPVEARGVVAKLSKVLPPPYPDVPLVSENPDFDAIHPTQRECDAFGLKRTDVLGQDFFRRGKKCVKSGFGQR